MDNIILSAVKKEDIKHAAIGCSTICVNRKGQVSKSH